MKIATKLFLIEGCGFQTAFRRTADLGGPAGQYGFGAHCFSPLDHQTSPRTRYRRNRTLMPNPGPSNKAAAAEAQPRKSGDLGHRIRLNWLLTRPTYPNPANSSDGTQESRTAMSACHRPRPTAQSPSIYLCRSPDDANYNRPRPQFALHAVRPHLPRKRPPDLMHQLHGAGVERAADDARHGNVDLTERTRRHAAGGDGDGTGGGRLRHAGFICGL